MSIHEGFRGRLEACLRKREIIPALMSSSLLTEDELHVPLQLRFNEKMPVVISTFEYYRFLSKLIDTVLSESKVQLVLVRVKMPAFLPLPGNLLNERVAIFYDLAVESEALALQGTDHLCVDADFKLYTWSAGDNEFSIRWVSPAGNRLSGDVIEKIRDVVATLPARFDYFSDSPAGER